MDTSIVCTHVEAIQETKGGTMTQRKKDKKHGVSQVEQWTDKVVPPSKYKIVIYNDDYTPFQDVEFGDTCFTRALNKLGPSQQQYTHQVKA